MEKTRRNEVLAKSADENYCSSCGAIIKKEAEICPKCGVRQKEHSKNTSGKNKTTALILSLLGFVCIAGIHRFYVGKIGTGILWLFTIGFFGVGTLVDLIMIASGSFKDKDGNILKSN